MGQIDFEDWHNDGKKLDNQEVILNFEKTNHLQLPDTYKKLVRFRDEGTMENYLFSYEFDQFIDNLKGEEEMEG